MILYNLHIAILFVASCHVDKEVIWRTTVNEDISTLQNIQDTNLLVLYKHLFLHLAKVAQIFTYFTQYILESIETDRISFSFSTPKMRILTGFSHFLDKNVFICFHFRPKKHQFLAENVHFDSLPFNLAATIKAHQMGHVCDFRCHRKWLVSTLR